MDWTHLVFCGFFHSNKKRQVTRKLALNIFHLIFFSLVPFNSNRKQPWVQSDPLQAGKGSLIFFFLLFSKAKLFERNPIKGCAGRINSLANTHKACFSKTGPTDDEIEENKVSLGCLHTWLETPLFRLFTGKLKMMSTTSQSPPTVFKTTGTNTA